MVNRTRDDHRLQVHFNTRTREQLSKINPQTNSNQIGKLNKTTSHTILQFKLTLKVKTWAMQMLTSRFYA